MEKQLRLEKFVWLLWHTVENTRYVSGVFSTEKLALKSLHRSIKLFELGVLYIDSCYTQKVEVDKWA